MPVGGERKERGRREGEEREERRKKGGEKKRGRREGEEREKRGRREEREIERTSLHICLSVCLSVCQSVCLSRHTSPGLKHSSSRWAKIPSFGYTFMQKRKRAKEKSTSSPECVRAKIMCYSGRRTCLELTCSISSQITALLK